MKKNKRSEIKIDQKKKIKRSEIKIDQKKNIKRSIPINARSATLIKSLVWYSFHTRTPTRLPSTFLKFWYFYLKYE